MRGVGFGQDDLENPPAFLVWGIDAFNYTSRFDIVESDSRRGVEQERNFPSCQGFSESSGACFVSTEPIDVLVRLNVPTNRHFGLNFRHEGRVQNTNNGGGDISSFAGFSISILDENSDVLLQTASGMDYSKMSAPVPEPEKRVLMLAGVFLISAVTHRRQRL